MIKLVIYLMPPTVLQKSKNYDGQKHLWSEQKKMPLVKWWVVRLAVGYILLNFD